MTKAGVGASLTVSSSLLSFSSSFSLSQTFTVNSNTSYTISRGDATWFTVSPTSGAYLRTITVVATANTSASPRTGTITITAGGKTETVNVTQEKFVPALIVSESSINFEGGYSTHKSTFNITSNTSWKVESGESWLWVSPSSGSNNGTVTVTADNYMVKKTPREGTITVSGGGITQKIKVKQMGLDDYLDVDYNSLDFSFNNDSGLDVYIFSNINWTIRSSASWLTVSPSSGSDDKLVTVFVSENLTSSSRSATLTVSGSGLTQVINVSQSGAVAKGNIAFWTSSNCSAGYVSVTLTGHGTKEITGYYPSGSPTCGSQHTATFTDLPIGTYSYTASCGSRTVSGTVKRTGSCHSVRLSFN